MNVEPKPPAGPRVSSNALWQDPDDSVKCGLLLSDRIRFYVDQVRMIEPFDARRLSPASYDLTLGSECWFSEFIETTGRAKHSLAKGENLIIPPNSIVFVSTAEVLNLPFYMVGRFNLRLKLLHEGLLVGAGPQVDPGFSGQLSCPLHNISSEKIALTCGEPFAVIEFEKTTPFGQSEKWLPETTENEIRQRGEALLIKGLSGYPCLTFPQRSLGREPVKGYLPPGKFVSSSVESIQNEVAEISSHVTKELDDFQSQIHRINVLAFVAVIGVAISLGTYFWAAVNWHRTVYDAAFRAQEQTKQIEAGKNRLDSEVKELTKKITDLSETVTTLQAKKAGNKTPPHQ